MAHFVWMSMSSADQLGSGGSSARECRNEPILLAACTCSPHQLRSFNVVFLHCHISACGATGYERDRRGSTSYISAGESHPPKSRQRNRVGTILWCASCSIVCG